jgi:cytochrome P450
MPLVLTIVPGGAYPPAYIEAFEEICAVMRQAIEERREEPGDDLLSLIVAAHDAGSLTDDEMLGNAVAVAAGALSATASSTAILLWSLAQHPDQYELVRREPNLAPGAVEESLRYHPPGLFGFQRYPLEDTELAGTPVWKDMPIQTAMAAADFDPKRFPDPLRFDVRRAPKRMLVFGTGAHVCIGARIARMIMNVTLQEVIGRFETMSLTEPDFTPVYGGIIGELAPRSIPMCVG